MTKKKLSALEYKLKKLSVLVNATFVSKAEASAKIATVAETESAMDELT